jgi:signal transduction histidine kinase
MSHELRTPLNAVIGFSDLIAEQRFGPGNPRYTEYGRLIHKSGQYLLKIINDILDIAKLRSGRTELDLAAIDPASSMREALALLQQQAEAKGIALSCEANVDVPTIMADSTRLQQVLTNLLSNAVKFTPAGGKVRASVAADRDSVTFEVSDTGIGITAEDLPRALEPFGQIENAMTRTQQGTGLGLPLAKNLVELHGGSFEMRSEPGIGTVVRATFPCGGPRAAARSSPSKSAA